jgi:hypothetical protein
MPRKTDPYAGLAQSYLIDPRPVEYWNVQVKPGSRYGWTSCTRYSNKVKADRDLRSTQSWIRNTPSTTKRVFRIVAHIN